MALSFIKLFEPLQLAAAAAQFYLCPVNPTTTVLKNGRVRLTNTTGAAVPATLYAVPASGGAGVTNEFVAGQSVPANSFVDIDVPTLAAGDTLWGFAGTAASITIHEMGGVLYS